MSLVLQDIENTVLMEMANFFKRSGYTIGVYMYDGMMIYRRENEEDLPPALLRECEVHVRESTSWEITLTVKK